MPAFRKLAAMTDIHWGEHLDSPVHNQDCTEFVEWFCGRVRAQDCDAIWFGGDWFHNKVRTDNATLHIAEQSVRRLSELDIPIFWSIGNHDVVSKTHRGVDSLPFLDQYKNIRVINSVQKIDDVLWCPWPCGDEFAKIVDIEAKYVFGHFELPTFLMNQVIEAPDEGGLHADHFYQCEAVFSGHFHKRQTKANTHGIPVTYIGNCFPHNFNDVHDDDRGMMILEWGGLPQYERWPDAPNFVRITSDAFLEALEAGDMSRFTAKSVVEFLHDISMADEDLIAVRESLGVRQFLPRPANVKKLAEMKTEEVVEDHHYATFDDLVVDHLKKLDTQGRYSTERLVQLYRDL